MIIDKRLNPETMAKNQKIDLNPRYCDRIPPMTGPIPCPNMRTWRRVSFEDICRNGNQPPPNTPTRLPLSADVVISPITPAPSQISYSHMHVNQTFAPIEMVAALPAACKARKAMSSP